MALSKRLQTVVSLVTPGKTFADIGTDHAFVPIELVKSGRCPKGLACDVRPGPLSGAEEHIRQSGLSDRIGTRLGDGLPALLRSLASTRMDLTAGTAQNLKLSADLFRKHPDVVRDLIDTAFDMGILSLNISVMDRGEMEDAMIHPELHQNLFVRVGGFSARFVNLDSGTQADMLSRALY